MKAVVCHGIGDIRLEDVPEPRIQDSHDAIVRITASAICGTDLHMVRGTVTGMVPGTILGHEGVGVVEEVGRHVRNLSGRPRGVLSTIACGYCSYCRDGYYSQCDNANPNGKRAGTAFFGGPKTSGPFHGLQAERARIPFANMGLVKLPDEVSDDQAILISDIFPTGYFGADLAEIKPGDTVAVFGCGPVGLFAIEQRQAAQGAGASWQSTNVAYRLEMAREQGAEMIDFSHEDPVQVILELTGGIGVIVRSTPSGSTRRRPRGPGCGQGQEEKKKHRQEVETIAPEADRKREWAARAEPLAGAELVASSRCARPAHCRSSGCTRKRSSRSRSARP